MATQEITFPQSQLEERKRRLEAAIAVAPQNNGLGGLLREVDSALERMDKGNYGLCEECHEPVEQERLMADPLVGYCLDHLTQPQRAELQRDLDLASQVQRNLLRQAGLRAGGWETSYHYAPVGPVSGDYRGLIPSDGQLFFALGDVSGKGVAASMLMTQLHALFRSLTTVALPLGQIVTQANRVFCESALRVSTSHWCAGRLSLLEMWKSTTLATGPLSSSGAVACCGLNPRVYPWECSSKLSSPPHGCNWKLATRCSSRWPHGGPQRGGRTRGGKGHALGASASRAAPRRANQRLPRRVTRLRRRRQRLDDLTLLAIQLCS